MSEKVGLSKEQLDDFEQGIAEIIARHDTNKATTILATEQPITKTLQIDDGQRQMIDSLLNLTGNQIYDKYGLKANETITNTVNFGNGYEMDIKLVVCDSDETPYTEAVLFKDGRQIGYTEPNDLYCGDWQIEADGKVFSVSVEAAHKELENNIRHIRIGQCISGFCKKILGLVCCHLVALTHKNVHNCLCTYDLR